MFAVQDGKKPTVTFVEDEASAETMMGKVTSAIKDTPLADPTKRFLLYNVSMFLVSMYGIIQYGEVLAI